MPIVARAAAVAVSLFTMAACADAEPSVDESEQTALTTAMGSSELTAAAEVASVPETASLPAVADTERPSTTAEADAPVASPLTGAAVLVAEDFHSLAGLRVGLIANQTSAVDGAHLIDLMHGNPVVDLVAVFAPEHGVRGVADAGEEVGDTTDPKTGLPIYSLYGASKAPTASQLETIDVLVYDLQDVGSRFYTYISTMGLSMQAAAAADIPFVVLDRPNPLGGDLIAGPIRDADQVSFVSQYPIPSVYGLTAGELATAIAGEAWLSGLGDLDLRVIRLEGWVPSLTWLESSDQWTPPSPGLPTAEAAVVYPGTVLFETTTLSYGKGTDHPYTTIGAPWVDGDQMADRLNRTALPGATFTSVTFTPDPALAPGGTASTLRLAAQESHGVRVSIADASEFRPVETGMHLLVEFRDHAEEQGIGSIVDRRPMFNLLAGSTELLALLESGATAEELIASWRPGIAGFRQIRDRYELYPR